jgi:Ca-activated chloride channel family protein
MRFADPWWFLLLLLLPVPFLLARRRKEGVAYPALHVLGPARASFRVVLHRALPWLRALALVLLVVILARPQGGSREVEVTSEGVDIVLAVDVSGSMKAEDFRPRNRLHVAKEVAKKFVSGRANDRIGLVVFAGQAYTQCPVTLDYGMLGALIDRIDFGGIQDGTAVGMGIATAVNRLRTSPAKSKVIICLTDGRNNAGSIDPRTAAELAKSLGIRIYTIGVGVEGDAPYPVDDPVFGTRYVRMPSEVDDAGLREVATLTGGLYFRATTPEALARIYDKIGQLEKTKIETREYTHYTDMAPGLALPVLALLSLEACLAGLVAVRVL